MSDPDPTLLGFLEGDPRAVACVRGWAERVVRSGGWGFTDPEGVVQEVLLKLVRTLRPAGARMSCRFSTFVFSVAKHTCIDVYRAEGSRAFVATGAAVPPANEGTNADPDERLRNRERREALRYVLQRLPEECRRLWMWVYADKLSTEEVSRRLGISVPNVRVRVHRCLEKAKSIAAAFVGGGMG